MTEASLRKIYFDTNVYICALEKNSDEALLVFRLFGGWDWQQHVIVTSELTLAEALDHPIEKALSNNDYTLHDSYHALIADEEGVREVIKLDRGILVRAALVRVQLRRLSARRIKLPDAIHLASALAAGCDTFVSADGALLSAARDICNRVGIEPGQPDPCLRQAVALTAPELSRLATELHCP